MNYCYGLNKSEGTAFVKDLKKGSVLRVPGNRASQSISCLKGMVWVTQDGDNRDRIVNRGDMYLSNLPHILVIYALKDAKIKICPEAKKQSIGRFQRIRQRVLSHA